MGWPRLPFTLAENRLARIERQKRRDGVALVDLTVSNPTRVGLPYPAREILAALAHPEALVYQPAPTGLTVAREAVARTYERHGVAVDPARIVLTASSSESYSFLFKLLCAAGERVRVPQPSYPLFDYLAALESVQIASYPVRFDGTWHRDFAALGASLEPADRAVVVVSPDNPTGAYLKKAEAAALAAVCEAGRVRRSGPAGQGALAVIADEVFLDFPVGADDGDRASTRAAVIDGPLTFALGGLSKAAGLPQLKVGWMVVGGEAAARSEALAALELIADTYLSVGTPVQLALPRLLELAPTVRDAITVRARESRMALKRSLEAVPECQLLEAEGGWAAIVRLPAVMTDELWAETLLEEHDVLVHPGAFYGFAGGAFLVVSLLPDPAQVADGAARLAALVRRRVDSPARPDY
jgi:aspartate/methionine/tyrosine aminotransferase